MPCLATVTAHVRLDATGPAPAGLYCYSCGGDGPEVNCLGEGFIGSLGFIWVVKGVFSSVAIVLNSLEVIGEQLRHTIIA